MTVRLLPYGPRAVLAEYSSLDEVMGVADELRRRALPGVVEIVPAARTVLVVHDGDVTGLHDVLLHPHSAPAPVAAPVVIPVRYDGEDLAAVAAAVGATVDEVVDMHSGASYTVAFCGFLPGFAYLVGLPPSLHLPRRSTPRPRVPVGSVAIAGEFTGVYPSASPGGWHLVGTTDAVLSDDARSEPALLAPGTPVRFDPT
ncbi:MAG: allophanate hydrolase subunit 1 [Ilumatobacteraceae bacterium]